MPEPDENLYMAVFMFLIAFLIFYLGNRSEKKKRDKEKYQIIKNIEQEVKDIKKQILKLNDKIDNLR